MKLYHMNALFRCFVSHLLYAVVMSCRQLQKIGVEKNDHYPDGVYKIYPTGSQPIMTYCDMSRDGGGWTLLVSSHTNSWTAQNVQLRNADSPKLNEDYSILQYADNIKDNINVAGSKFEYRLEAQSRGNVNADNIMCSLQLSGSKICQRLILKNCCAWQEMSGKSMGNSIRGMPALRLKLV